MVALTNPGEVSLVVMEVRVSPKVKKRIAERAEQGVCLHCGKPIYRRGLCTTHYTRFRTSLLELPKQQRPDHEAKMLELGQIVERGARRVAVNEFRQLARG